MTVPWHPPTHARTVVVVDPVEGAIAIFADAVDGEKYRGLRLVLDELFPGPIEN
jgi:hypothetical protein